MHCTFDVGETSLGWRCKVNTPLSSSLRSSMYVWSCMYVWSSHIARVWTNQVSLPILLVVSWTEKRNISLSAFAPEYLVSRDRFGSPVPRQSAHLHIQGESGAYLRDSSRVPRRSPFLYFKPPYAIGSVPSLSGHTIAYRWRSLPRVRRHRASKPQRSSERVLPWQVTMDPLICASLSNTHYWYEVGMLKVYHAPKARCYFFSFFFNLTYSRWTSSLPSCLWSQRVFPSLPGSRLTIFVSRCKFSTLTTRQPMVEFYLLTFPRFPLRKKEHKSYFGKNRTHDFRTSRCADYLLDHSGDEVLCTTL